MLRKEVTFEDFNGVNQTEECFFNLTKTELIEMAMDLPEGVSESVGDDPNNIDEEKAVGKLMETMGNKGVLKFIKDLVLKSYGVKSADGRRFMKVDENGKPLSIEFSQTMAFETIIDEFMSNDIAAANFVNGIFPSSVADKIPATKKTGPKKLPASSK